MSPLRPDHKKTLWFLPSFLSWITCSWEACYHVVRTLSVGGGHQENMTSELDPVLGMYCSAHLSHSGTGFKDVTLRE